MSNYSLFKVNLNLSLKISYNKLFNRFGHPEAITLTIYNLITDFR